MTTLAALAHAAATPPPAFNHDFYVTGGTVIPVLFLALTLQGRTFTDLMLANPAANLEFSAGALAVALAGPLLAAAITAAGSLGEILALQALYDGSASTRTAEGLLGITIFLVLVVTTVAPVFNAWMALRSGKPSAEEEDAGNWRSHSARRHPRYQPPFRLSPTPPKWAKRTQRTETGRNVRGG